MIPGLFTLSNGIESGSRFDVLTKHGLIRTGFLFALTPRFESRSCSNVAAVPASA